MKKIILTLFVVAFINNTYAQAYSGVKNIQEFNNKIPMLTEKYNLQSTDLVEFGNNIQFTENGEPIGYNYDLLISNLSPQQFVEFIRDVFSYKIHVNCENENEEDHDYFTIVNGVTPNPNEPYEVCTEKHQWPNDCYINGRYGKGCVALRRCLCSATGCYGNRALINPNRPTYLKWKDL